MYIKIMKILHTFKKGGGIKDLIFKIDDVFQNYKKLSSTFIIQTGSNMLKRGQKRLNGVKRGTGLDG